MRALDLVATWPVGSAAAGALGRHPHAGALPVRDGVWVLGATGEVDRSYTWASVTKLCTALAVLVAVEEGTLSLSEPAGPPGATVEHLLSHASGLAPDVREVHAAPGERRIYSNAGYDILGELLESRSGLVFAEYVAEAVFGPLGMSGARLERDGSPASGATGGLSDLLRLGAELLSPTIVAGETLARATRVAFPGLAGVLPGFGRQDPCDWGLGFEIRDGKEPHWTGARCSGATFGHFGRSGCFLWVDPRVGTVCGSLTDRDFGPWARTAWPELSDAVLATAAATVGGRPGG